MTVQSTTRKAGPFDGNGVTTAFPFDFKVFLRTDVRVVITDAAGVETDGVLDSNYTVALNGDQDADPGGTVTYPGVVGSVLPAGWKLTIVGAMPQSQLTDITNVGRFSPDVVEKAFDKNTILVQQLQEQVERAVLVPVSSSTQPADLINQLVGSSAAAVAAAATATAQAGAALDSAADAAASQAGAAAAEANANAAAANATAAAVVQVNLFKADVANSADVAKGAALMGYKLNAAGAVGRTLAAKLAEHVSVKDFGAVGNGVADDTAAFTAALNASRVVYVPAGTYKVSSAISLTQTGHSLIGEGRDVVTITSNAAATPVIVLAAGVASFRVEGMKITRSPTALAGGHGIQCLGSTQSTILRQLEITYCNYGLALGICDEGTIENVNCRLCTGYGIYCTNAVTYGAAQWRLRQITCSGCGADGIRFVTTPGPAGMILGAWDTIETYANSGAGISLLGSVTTPIFDFRLSNGFLGSDGIAGIYLDTYGGKHRVMTTFVERAGRDPTGPTFSTPAVNASHGINITSHNTDVSIANCLIDECSYNGVTHSGGVCVISGCTIYNNGAALVGGQRTGVNSFAGRIVVTGSAITNIGSALQNYGFASSHDNFTVSGCDLSNNALAPYALAAGLTHANLSGNLMPFVDQHIPGNLRKSGAAIYANP